MLSPYSTIRLINCVLTPLASFGTIINFYLNHFTLFWLWTGFATIVQDNQQ